ncbi:MAG: L,D-transpeptidase family protein, partial [Rhodomicrobium sp.]|nr:L,D-transpeptidase family protein [Rhodomicrobium sp.]
MGRDCEYFENLCRQPAWRLAPRGISHIRPCGRLVSRPIDSAAPRIVYGSIFRRDLYGRAAAAETQTDPLDNGPLFAVVSIADQQIAIYNDTGLAASSPVSTGMRGYSTPTGIFSILQKRRWHRSNIYSGAPMPMMQRLTWSGIALHAGHLPGYPASHGCIRMPASFAERFFGATRIGYRVIIAPRSTVPLQIAHAALPNPVFMPAPGEGQDKEGETASIGSVRAKENAHLERVGLSDAPAADDRLNPIDYARALKTEANRQVRASALALKAALQLSDKKADAARIAARKLALAENAAEDAERDLKAATRLLEKAMDEGAVAGAAKAKAKA